MGTTIIVNGVITSEVPDIFDKPELDKKISESIRGKQRDLPPKPNKADPA